MPLGSNESERLLYKTWRKRLRFLVKVKLVILSGFKNGGHVKIGWRWYLIVQWVKP